MHWLDGKLIMLKSLWMAYGYPSGMILADKTVDTTKGGGSGKSFAVSDNVSPFEYLQEADVYTEGTNSKGSFIPQMRSIYGLLMVIGAIGLVCSLVMAGAKIATCKNGQKFFEILETIGFKFLVAILMFTGLTMLGIYHTFLYRLNG